MELTAPAGSVVLAHPFMMHSRSNNPSGRPRFLTNGNVRLMKPLVARYGLSVRHGGPNRLELWSNGVARCG